MNSKPLNAIELRRQGIEALVKALRSVGMVSFLQQFDQGHGDYTHEREQLLAGVTLEEILATIEQNQTGMESLESDRL